jgi:5-methylthioribose kinase
VHSVERQPLVELDLRSAPDYVAEKCRLEAASVSVRQLAGGVSNTVLLVEHPCGRFVLKQSLPKLRVQQDWLSDRERIVKEASSLSLLYRHLPQGSVPEILFSDPDNYAYAMTAAPPEAETWKAELLRGTMRPDVAAKIGSILAGIIRSSWDSAAMREQYGELRVFDQLRLDPYYRTTAARHPEFAWYFEKLVSEYPRRARCLVHGDWSPKNFLVTDCAVMAIDFEAIHYGDPAFDAAFFLNHLLLKSFYLPDHAPELAEAAVRFWTALNENSLKYPDFEKMTLTHLPALLLARVDGKSPAEYITRPDMKETIREFARSMMRRRPRSVAAVWKGIPA